LHKRPVILRSLLIVATPYVLQHHMCCSIVYVATSCVQHYRKCCTTICQSAVIKCTAARKGEAEDTRERRIEHEREREREREREKEREREQVTARHRTHTYTYTNIHSTCTYIVHTNIQHTLTVGLKSETRG